MRYYLELVQLQMSSKPRFQEHCYYVVDVYVRYEQATRTIELDTQKYVFSFPSGTMNAKSIHVQVTKT
jgi:hypothetical protein